MNHSRLVPALTSLVVAVGLLAATPAQAWTPRPTTESGSRTQLLVPAEAPARVEFLGGTVQPAGTYWVAVDAATPHFDGWVETLSERFETPRTTWRSVTLSAPGRLAIDLPAAEVGRVHLVSVWAVPPGSGDPAALDDARRTQVLRAAAGAELTPLDERTVTAARVTAPSLTSEPPLPAGADQTYPPRSDFEGVGAQFASYRVGNVFHLSGLGGREILIPFGRATDWWFAGDWDGDGRDSIGLRRGIEVFLDDTFTGGTADVHLVVGRSGDRLLVADTDGDGADEIVLRRGSTFYVVEPSSGAVTSTFCFGRSTDHVEIGDWDGDGDETVGVVRDDVLHVRNTLTGGAAEGTYRVGA